MIKKAEATDAEKIAALAVQMWNTATVQGLTDEFLDTILQGNGQFF